MNHWDGIVCCVSRSGNSFFYLSFKERSALHTVFWVVLWRMKTDRQHCLCSVFYLFQGILRWGWNWILSWIWLPICSTWIFPEANRWSCWGCSACQRFIYIFYYRLDLNLITQSRVIELGYTQPRRKFRFFKAIIQLRIDHWTLERSEVLYSGFR